MKRTCAPAIGGQPRGSSNAEMQNHWHGPSLPRLRSAEPDARPRAHGNVTCCKDAPSRAREQQALEGTRKVTASRSAALNRLPNVSLYKS